MKYVRLGGASAVYCEVMGGVHYLLFNGAAMLEFNDRWGNAAKFFEVAGTGGEEKIKELAKGFEILSRQGELMRRRLKFDKKEMFDAEDVLLLAVPGDIAAMMEAVIEAVALGFKREITDEDEEIDLGLLEIQKKRRTHKKGRILFFGRKDRYER